MPPMNKRTSSPFNLEALLQEEPWLRALARALVGRDKAEDLAQEVVATALRDQPNLQGPNLRGWLRTVMRRTSMRRDLRKQLRTRAEEASARPENSGGSTEERAAERLRLHRLLTTAIGDLEPPYQTVLVLKYLEELSHGEIAERMGISPAAARQRLSRGLKLLRDRLDREFNGNGDWMSSMTFLALGTRETVALAASTSTTTSSRTLTPAGAQAVGFAGFSLAAMITMKMILAVASVAALAWLG